MRIVLDTNVVVSGLLNAFGPSGQIVRLVAAGNLELCYDARILTEYRHVLLRPKFRFVAAEAFCLVTGNLKDYPRSSTLGIRVVSPREFMDEFVDAQSP